MLLHPFRCIYFPLYKYLYTHLRNKDMNALSFEEKRCKISILPRYTEINIQGYKINIVFTPVKHIMKTSIKPQIPTQKI